jgi:hypothetical protein
MRTPAMVIAPYPGNPAGPSGVAPAGFEPAISASPGALSRLVGTGSPGGVRTRDLSLAGRAQGALSRLVETGSPGGIRTRDLSLERAAS